MAPNLLLAASAAILAFLGCAHLVLTYRGPKLRPRDPAVAEAMAGSAPVITRQTDIWRMWIGFNASHSMGAMLFGLVYGYLALVEGDLLFDSLFLQAVGVILLAGFTILAKLYWFITPFAASAVALLLYCTALAWAWAS